MKASLILICLAAVALSPSAAVASAPATSTPVARLVIPSAADVLIPATERTGGFAASAGEMKMAAMNAYLTLKGQKSDTIKRKQRH